MTRTFIYSFAPPSLDPSPGATIALDVSDIEDAGIREVLQAPGAAYGAWSIFDAYMASISWQYPQHQLIALRRQNAQAEAARPIAGGVDLANINFRYAIDGDRAATIGRKSTP